MSDGDESSGRGVRRIFERVVLKMSGEALGEGDGGGISGRRLEYFCSCIERLQDAGVQTGVVCGGGNIFRGAGAASFGVDRVSGDYMGMLATTINAIALRAALEARGRRVELFTPFHLPAFAEAYSPLKARKALEGGAVVLFSGGTGIPYFSTDTAGALRAAEVGAGLLLKGTKVDGVYSADPCKDPEAVRYDRLTFSEVLERNLGVMDAAAVAICRDAGIPVFVFDLFDEAVFASLAEGRLEGGTLIEAGPG